MAVTSILDACDTESYRTYDSLLSRVNSKSYTDSWTGTAMTNIVHKMFRLYRADGSQLLAFANVRNIHSERTQDSESEVIQRVVSYSLRDGTGLNQIDESTFESTSGERFTSTKPK